MTDEDVAAVLALERELQLLSTRADGARLRELLAPTFLEIGASGRRWDRESILAMLAEETRVDHEPIRMTDLSARVLAPGVVQVFWDSERGGRRARRTSLWQRTDAGWQQTYHQGTPLP